jgi:DNA-binding transcriptional LysR family regulator
MHRDLELLPHYALFALVVHRRSMSQAAREAGLTRSAVSQRIRRLEDVVGTVLLRRNTRRVTPTEAGNQLLASCSRLLEDLGAIRGVAASRAGSAPLRVNGPSNLLRTCAESLLVQFTEQHPGPVELEVNGRLVDLVDARADVVLRIARKLPESAIARRLALDRFIVVASPDYLARRGEPRTPHELAVHDCLRYTVSRLEDEWRFHTPEGEVVAPARFTWSADDGELLLRLALAGRGLLVTPSFMVAEAVKHGALKVVLEGYRKDSLGIWAVLPEGRRASRRARAFVDFLARRMERALPGLEAPSPG